MHNKEALLLEAARCGDAARLGAILAGAPDARAHLPPARRPQQGLRRGGLLTRGRAARVGPLPAAARKERRARRRRQPRRADVHALARGALCGGRCGPSPARVAARLPRAALDAAPVVGAAREPLPRRRDQGARPLSSQREGSERSGLLSSDHRAPSCGAQAPHVPTCGVCEGVPCAAESAIWRDRKRETN